MLCGLFVFLFVIGGIFVIVGVVLIFMVVKKFDFVIVVWVFCLGSVN